MNAFDLTNDELVAKQVILKLYTQGVAKEFVMTENMKLPQWFDEAKFYRAQKFYSQNRLSFFEAGVSGLIILFFSEPLAIKLLKATEKSSTPETAKKRYISTILHTLSWYESELKPGSESWKSLEKVRIMHNHASKMGQKLQLGFVVSQKSVAFTAFGFFGLVLLKSRLLGINNACEEDFEALIHFWAVISNLLGVEDEFNIYLNSSSVVRLVFSIYLRYIVMPMIQLENPDIKLMAKSFVDGFKEYVPTSYERKLFLLRRLIGIPGYQYNIDLNEERLMCRNIFTNNELATVKEYYLNHNFWNIDLIDEDFQLLKIESKSSCDSILNPCDEVGHISINDTEQICFRKLQNQNSWNNSLNDSAYRRFNEIDQKRIRFGLSILEKYNCNFIAKFLINFLSDFMIFKMRKFSGIPTVDIDINEIF
uniref:ER-bound oxygenase mpaB/mpaB'/Rubber oxygenase catalytic domain-containing protein n=1 Tax=Corethrella appendiculata TaxID=1370023 RepID=U5EP54_9DIPT